MKNCGVGFADGLKKEMRIAAPACGLACNDTGGEGPPRGAERTDQRSVIASQCEHWRGNPFSLRCRHSRRSHRFSQRGLCVSTRRRRGAAERCSALRSTVYGSSFSVLRSPFSVLRSPFPVHCSPFTVHSFPLPAPRSSAPCCAPPARGCCWPSPSRRG